MTKQAKSLTASRFVGVERPYTRDEVERLRPSVVVEHTLARVGAEHLWELLHERDYVNALGALTGNQAVQQVRAGLEAIYLSGWQVAADANLAGQMYPDQSRPAARRPGRAQRRRHPQPPVAGPARRRRRSRRWRPAQRL